ncbi:hypothetical protein GCM10009718_27690 [Isoptericola halotolerans]|uniref:Flp pilus assembly protein CpaB n=1 Tax=Isoptericola halotolerans TaxID=300560 RepID=A0ABX2A6Z9_9MICO|nr:SAF domain-containing protein [Isoptericola halotolerans]NOV97381.1 Flp pilus assembly protein CpaB [Isoptericola halotolerans]
MHPTSRTRLARHARTLLWRCRFVVAALCCGLAAGAIVQAVRPEPPATREVVVTARALSPGTTLRPGDLDTLTVAAELAPPDVLTDTDDAVGRSPAVALPAGVPLHDGLVAGGGVAAQAPDGTVVVGVRLTESAWLRPGDRVDLLATEDDADPLARRALVLPGLEPDDAGAGTAGLLGGASPAAGRDAAVTLVAVDPGEAAAVSAAAEWGAVAAVLVP